MRRLVASALVGSAVACTTANAEPAKPQQVAAATSPPSPSSAREPAAPSDRSAPTALARYRTVLHVGDSMVGYKLGVQLELGRMIRAAGGVYESHTVTAAGLRSFATSRIVEQLVAEKRPDLVIVQLGTNNLTVPTPDAYAPDIRSIAQQVGARPCYWIGPPPLVDRPEKGMRRVLRASVAPCVFFDSYGLELTRQPDGIHPTQPAAKKWAEAFWRFSERGALR